MTWDLTWEQITGFFGMFGGTILAYLAYRRSVKVDRISAQSGAVDSARAGTAQIIEGLNNLIDNLQEDNKAFREDLKHITGRLEECMTAREVLKHELLRLRRKYGENGTEGG